ncbi:ficolin-1-like [Ochlerotatus camptorhynchus]|uniref:ficolin-1-like n=1 Tax=Ochlerotatus camptorhynchus TaxID=644619 RepID=UPI0031D8FB36
MKSFCLIFAIFGCALAVCTDEREPIVNTIRSLVDGDIIQFSACPDVNTNGVYPLQAVNVTFPPFSVFCDYSVDGKGWIVIHRRLDGSVSFNRNWTDYRDGFGSLQGEFWLGLEKMHQIIRGGRYQLLVVLQDFYGAVVTAQYDNFTIGCEMDRYRLEYGEFLNGTVSDSLLNSNGMQFSTPDSDNDLDSTEPSCAEYYTSGWWFNACHEANLNGVYDKYRRSNTMSWYNFYYNHQCLKAARMMIRFVGEKKYYGRSMQH